MKKKLIGRPPVGEEAADIRKGITFQRSVSDRLERMKKETGVPVATFIKHSVDKALESFESGEDEGSSIPFIQGQQTGEFDEIIRDARRVEMGTFGELIGVKAGDFLVRVMGEDLESDDPKKHVPDGAILLMRPYRFTVGEICYVRVLRTDGTVEYTIKKLTINPKNSAIELRNGRDEIVNLTDVENIYPIAVERAIIVGHDELYHKEVGRWFMWCQENNVDHKKASAQEIDLYYHKVRADATSRQNLERYLRPRQTRGSEELREMSLKSSSGDPDTPNKNVSMLKTKRSVKTPIS